MRFPLMTPYAENPSPQPVSETEALHALQTEPLLELGRRAFAVKQRLYGDRITYVINRHVNPTNLCVYSCRFCDFAAKPGDSHAYSLDESEIFRAVADPELREVHLVGGLWPKWGFHRSVALVRDIRRARPGLWIKAFTAVEIAYFAQMERSTADEILVTLRAAGVDALPGGGAEVLSKRLHKELFPNKCGPEDWLHIHETAHRLGIPTNATLLFGHLETDEEIVAHLFKLRRLQARTSGFQSFIPLAYQPGKSKLTPELLSPIRCLRVIALARIVLDNVPHIKAYWPTLGVETAAAALSFGADDLDGTLGDERIMHYAGSDTPSAVSAMFMESIIREAGQISLARSGDFQSVESHRGEPVPC